MPSSDGGCSTATCRTMPETGNGSLALAMTYAGAREEPAGEERAVLDRLRELDPDALTPKEALELLYRLRRQLDE